MPVPENRVTDYIITPADWNEVAHLLNLVEAALAQEQTDRGGADDSINNRLGGGLGTTTDGITGTATAQLAAARTRLANLEAATGTAATGARFVESATSSLGNNAWTGIALPTKARGNSVTAVANNGLQVNVDGLYDVTFFLRAGANTTAGRNWQLGIWRGAPAGASGSTRIVSKHGGQVTDTLTLGDSVIRTGLEVAAGDVLYPAIYYTGSGVSTDGTAYCAIDRRGPIPANGT